MATARLRWTLVVLQLGPLVLVAVAAVRQFGWLNGLAIASAVYLIMPWAPPRIRA